jgi:hypothetical protein
MASANLPRPGELREEKIPFLEPGDRLTRDEFERRYSAMPNLKKAELIEGVVYRRNGVREYVVWRVLDQQLDWFVLEAGQFQPLVTDDAGILPSELFCMSKRPATDPGVCI